MSLKSKSPKFETMAFGKIAFEKRPKGRKLFTIKMMTINFEAKTCEIWLVRRPSLDGVLWMKGAQDGGRFRQMRASSVQRYCRPVHYFAQMLADVYLKAFQGSFVTMLCSMANTGDLL